MELSIKTRRFILSGLLILTLSACATTGNPREEKASSARDEIIFGVGTNVGKEPIPQVQDLGKCFFGFGERIGIMILVKGYVGQKIRLDFIRMEDNFTRTVISEIVPAPNSPGGAIFWWHNEKIWSVKGGHPETWAVQLKVGAIVKRHEFVVSP